MSHDSRISSLQTYLLFLAQEKAQSISIMNNGLAWAVSTMAIGLSALVAAQPEPSIAWWIVPALQLIMLSRFLVWMVRGYVNLIRWTTIEREVIVELGLTGSTSSDDGGRPTRAEKAIETYHQCWASPLSFQQVMYKGLINFGFIYLYRIGVVFLTLGLLLTDSPCGWGWKLVPLLVPLLIAAWEIDTFQRRSRYFKRVEANAGTAELR